jgi:hypothetical protein
LFLEVFLYGLLMGIPLAVWSEFNLHLRRLCCDGLLKELAVLVGDIRELETDSQKSTPLFDGKDIGPGDPCARSNLTIAGNIENDINPVVCAKWQRLRVGVAIVEERTINADVPRYPI